MVLFNPVYDNSEKGYGYSRVKDYWRKISPMHNITKDIPPTIVFLGDSITQGWGTLEADFPGKLVANRGISGDTSRGVRYRLREDVLDLFLGRIGPPEPKILPNRGVEQEAVLSDHPYRRQASNRIDLGQGHAVQPNRASERR